MKEQKDQLKGKSVIINKRKTKFNLDGDSDEEELNFLTHKGKKIEIDKIDDFKDNLSKSDDDDYEDRDLAKGVMNKEMVDSLNFGGGLDSNADNENFKKSREERHQEIMNKSKAFKYHR